MTNFRMIVVGILIISTIGITNEIWLNDYDTAIEKAKIEEKPLLLVFSGSDWCKPCIRLDEQVFQSEEFKEYANEHLILLKADFPRGRKNRLPVNQQLHNDQLAEHFNPNGMFPYVVLINPKDKSKTVISTEVESGAEFIKQFK